MPAAEVALELRGLATGNVQRELAFDGYVDTVTLRPVIAAGELDVSFTMEDEGARQGDYYYVRIVQANDAIAWSSPIWVGGYPPR